MKRNLFFFVMVVFLFMMIFRVKIPGAEYLLAIQQDPSAADAMLAGFIAVGNYERTGARDGGKGICIGVGLTLGSGVLLGTENGYFHGQSRTCEKAY